MSKSVNILLVEDEKADVYLMTRLLSALKVENSVSSVSDGDQALSFLYEAHERKNMPDLILLDINMPGKNGKETLKIIKNDEKLRAIPVIMLTSSCDENDILYSYREHANAYIQKPFGLQEMSKVIQKIESFWFNLVRLPTKLDSWV